MAVRKKKIYELLEVSRYRPIIGAEKLLKFNLPYHQQDMLKRVWNHKNVILLCSRRTGKTFIMALFAALQAALYMNLKIGIVAPVFRQAQTVFEEVENIIDRSPFLQAQIIDEPAHASAEWYVDWKSGSRISALPLSNNIRSKGFGITLIDEYGYEANMNDKVKNIIDPMLLTNRDIEVENVHPTSLGTRKIMASTATYKFNDYYKKVKEFEEKIKNGKSDKYDIISYDYRDGLESGIFEEERVMDQINSVDSITRKKEYLNIFPDDDSAFINYEMIQKYCIDTYEEVDEEKDEYKEPDTQIEFEGDKNYEYILTFDDADTGDNFAISLIKLDGNVKRIVRIITLNDVPIQEKIKVIRKLLKDFNVVEIACDQRNKNIKDNLAKPWAYEDGTEGAIILDKDDEEQARYVRKEYGSSANTEKLIKVYNFTGKTNETRARNFRAEIENGRVKYPAPIGLKNQKEVEAMQEIKTTFTEITAIQPEAHGKYTQYKPPTRSQKKDRWTVSELGVWAADQYRKSNTTDTSNITVGIVNTGRR